MSRWTESDIPDQTGRTHLITGANSGIGVETARALAQRGAHVVMACRDASKAEVAVGEIEATDPPGTVDVLELDLADLESVEGAAERFLAEYDHLDVLINNAGVMALPLRRTAQGFEMQIGVNHLGHFAFTGHLIEALMAVDGSRVVTVSSQGHRPGMIKFDDLNSTRGYSPWPAYFQSKLANLLFTRELQRRLDDAGSTTIAVAAHPGIARTNLGRDTEQGLLGTMTAWTRPMFDAVVSQDAAMGALPTLRAATDPAVAGGDYFGPDGIGESRGHPKKVGMSGRARRDADGRRLWELSSDLTGITYPI